MNQLPSISPVTWIVFDSYYAVALRVPTVPTQLVTISVRNRLCSEVSPPSSAPVTPEKHCKIASVCLLIPFERLPSN